MVSRHETDFLKSLCTTDKKQVWNKRDMHVLEIFKLLFIALQIHC